MKAKRKNPLVSHPSFRSRYQQHAAEYGVQYYLTARYALMAGLTPVSAGQAHHAIEMLLKSCLAKDDSGEQIAEYRNLYGHKLEKLWAEFCKRNGHLNLDPSFNKVVKALDRFEDIRYPDTLIIEGAQINVGLVEPDPPTSGGPLPPERHFHLYLPALERLVSVLFRSTGIASAVFEPLLQQAATRTRAYIEDLIKPKPFSNSPP